MNSNMPLLTDRKTWRTNSTAQIERDLAIAEANVAALTGNEEAEVIEHTEALRDELWLRLFLKRKETAEKQGRTNPTMLLAS
jgi:hypothetical protein